MNQDEMPLIPDGTPLYDSENHMYGVLVWEEANSDWLTIRWDNGKKESFWFSHYRLKHVHVVEKRIPEEET